VREAYFQLARRYHPDVHRGPAFTEVSDKIEAILVRLGEAYEVLKDPARRGSYESLVASKMPRPLAGDGTAVSTSGPSSAGDSQLGAKLVEEALRSGEKLFSEEKYWEAIQAVESQLSKTHGKMRIRARVLLAKSYLKNPKWVKRAEEQLGLAVEEEPKHVEAHFLLASIYLGGGLRSRALSKFRKVLELQPDHEEARARVTELTPPPEPTPPPSGGFIKRIFGRGQEE
jgi:curved DNA-binding protein CbpA